jgi:hypothetical protein
VTDTRPKGGRRREDFPEIIARDELIFEELRRGPRGRNELADQFGLKLKLITYALDRLRDQGRVRHIKQGNQGHGVWAVEWHHTPIKT